MERSHSSLSSSDASDSNDQRYESDGMDYLSYMPMEVVLHIFSFLPLKYWILMCLVSKRWKDFWTHIPNLELNGPVMVQSHLKKNMWCSLCDVVHNYNARNLLCHLHLRKTAIENFLSVVDRILLLHSGCTITRFHLFINYGFMKEYTSRIDAWVDFSMTRNIEKLELNFSGGQIVTNFEKTSNFNKYTLYRFKSPSPFAPEILKTLTLIGCIFELDVFAYFKCLQRLYVIDAGIYGGSIGNLLSKCPLLEALNLKRCLIPKTFMICTEELKIKELFLIECVTSTLTLFPIDIIAPSLSTLKIVGQHLTSFSFKKATNLVNADIGIKCRFSDPALRNIMAALLIDLSQCHSLELNNWCIQFLPTRISPPWQLPLKFQNLKHLRLRTHITKHELPRLSYLFSSCTNLETLTLDIKLPEHDEIVLFGVVQNNFLNADEDYWESLSCMFHCMQSSIKKVNINGYAGRPIEIHMVKLLLQNAMVLEELNIAPLEPTTSMSSEVHLIELMRLLLLHKCSLVTSFAKASQHARIKISY